MWLNEDPPGQQGQGQCLSQGSLGISGGAGARGGTWSWRLVEKKLVLLLVTTSLRQKTPKDMLLPSPAPQGPGDCWVSGSVLPQEEISPLTLLFQILLRIPLRIPSHTHRPVAVVLVVLVLVREVI